MTRPLVSRAAAVAEVVGALAVVHLSFRAFKQGTDAGRAEVAAGLNFSPGIAMIVVGLTLLAVSRGSLVTRGLIGLRLTTNVGLGVLSTVIFAACCAGPWLAGMRHAPGQTLGAKLALTLIGCNLATIALFLLLCRPPQRARPALATCSFTLASLLLAVTAVIAPVTLLWLTVAAVGEEVFFRGYVQSRINDVVGRPYRLLGTPYGFGLVFASLLFGLIHVFNPYDPFTGQGHLAWWHGLASATAPFAFLRERTGSLVAPITLHLLTNLIPRLPGVL